MVDLRYPRTARVIIAFTINGSDWGDSRIGGEISGGHVICKEVNIISDTPEVTAKLLGETLFLRTPPDVFVPYKGVYGTCIVEGIFEIKSPEPAIMAIRKGDIGSTTTTIQGIRYENNSPCCWDNRNDFSVPTITWPPACPLAALADISFPAEFPSGESLAGSFSLKNDGVADGEFRAQLVDADTGNGILETDSVVLGAGQSKSFNVTMNMPSKTLNLRISAQSMCDDEWKTDDTRDLSIGSLLPKASITNLSFSPSIPQISKYSIKFTLTNIGQRGKLLANIIDKDTDAVVFSSGEVLMDANESKDYELSNDMPCQVLNYELRALAQRSELIMDSTEDIQIVPCYASGVIEDADFPEGAVPGDELSGLFSAANIGCEGRLRASVTDVDTGIKAILPETLLMSKEYKHTTKMPGRDLRLALATEHFECDSWIKDSAVATLIVKMTSTSNMNTGRVYELRGGQESVDYTGVINGRNIQGAKAIESGISAMDEIDSPLPARKTFLFFGTVRRGETHLIPFDDVSYFKIKLSSPMAVVQDGAFIRKDTEYEFSNIRAARGLGLLKVPMPRSVSAKLFSDAIEKLEARVR